MIRHNCMESLKRYQPLFVRHDGGQKNKTISEPASEPASANRAGTIENT